MSKVSIARLPGCLKGPSCNLRLETLDTLAMLWLQVVYARRMLPAGSPGGFLQKYNLMWFEQPHGGDDNDNDVECWQNDNFRSSLVSEGSGRWWGRKSSYLQVDGGGDSGHGGGGHNDCDNQNAPRHIYVALPFWPSTNLQVLHIYYVSEILEQLNQHWILVLT